MRLAAIDLDGTLIRSDGTISERTRAAVRSAVAAGVDVIPITARGPGWLDELGVLGLGGPAICSNGAVLVDLATREVERMRTIETEVALALEPLVGAAR